MDTPKWEYEVYVAQVGREGFVVRPELDPGEFKARLNWFGGQGWELISVFDVNMLQGGSKQVVATFKRPLAAVPMATAVDPADDKDANG
jgi:hypothetical protein